MTDDDKAKDKTIIKESAKRKADLQDGADTTVAKGDEPAPPPKADPADQRKAIYARSSEARRKRIAAQEAEHPEVIAHREARERALAGEDEESERTRSERTPTELETRDKRSGKKDEKPDDSPDESKEGEGVASVDDAVVKITVNGREFEVPKRDVERAGGVEAYQKQRAAAQMMTEAAREREAVKAERENLERERQELARQRAESADKGAPATKPGSQTRGQPPAKGAAGDAEVEAKALKVVDALYSGDRKAAADAVRAILSEQPTLTPQQVANEAVKQLREQETPPAQQQPSKPSGKPQVDSARMVEMELLNRAIPAEYPDIMADTELLALARTRTDQAMRDPKNKDRAAVDVARDQCDYVRKHYGKGQTTNPRESVAREKQGLPPSTSSAARTPGASGAPKKLDYFEARRRQAGRA